MTDEYIRKQDAVHTIMGQPPDAHYPSWYGAQIEAIPAADVVPVVFCKDCKYVQKFRSEESAKKFGQVYECLKYTIPCPNPTDFCSYGERKE